MVVLLTLSVATLFYFASSTIFLGGFASLEDQRVRDKEGGVLQDLQQRDPERKATVRIAEELVANGDAELLRIVLQNLLENAWEFTSRHPAATIFFTMSAIADGRG